MFMQKIGPTSARSVGSTFSLLIGGPLRRTAFARASQRSGQHKRKHPNVRPHTHRTALRLTERMEPIPNDAATDLATPRAQGVLTDGNPNFNTSCRTTPFVVRVRKTVLRCEATVRDGSVRRGRYAEPMLLDR